MKPIKPDCSEKVFRGWRYYPCSRKASVEVDGRHYCGTHDPVKRAAKDAEREANWNSKYAERKKRYALEAAAPDLLEAIKDLDEAFCISREHMTLEQDEFVRNALNAARAAIAKAEGRA